jgi:hypothetical protein
MGFFVFFLNSFFPSKNGSWALARVIWPIQLGGQASAFFTKRNVPSIYGDDVTDCKLRRFGCFVQNHF